MGDFDNERDALALVLAGIDRNGPDDTDTLSLDVEDEQVKDIVIHFSGQELAELATARIFFGAHRRSTGIIEIATLRHDPPVKPSPRRRG